MKKFLVGLTTLFLSLALISSNVLATGKAKVLFVYMDGCRMCEKFEKVVLSDPKVQNELKHFVFEKVNAQSSDLDVDVTPTILIYNKNNKQIRKFVPAINKDKFLEELRKAQ